MCKCYVLYGRANVGKTTSLGLVIEKLVANGAKEIKGVDISLFNSSDDRRILLEYKGKLIGITTRGDTRKALEKDFDAFKRELDLFVCACRTKGETCDFIKEYFSDIVWMKKIHTNNNYSFSIQKYIDKMNEIQAMMIIEEIESWITKM